MTERLDGKMTKRKFRIRRVVERVSSIDTTRRGGKQRTATNTVWLDCGHIQAVCYWPMRDHYRTGDRCRCYDCPRDTPKTTPTQWHENLLAEIEISKGTRNVQEL